MVAEVLLNLAQSRISRLGDFYDEGERHFNIEIKDLEDKTAHLTQEEWDWGEGNLSIELRHELEELRELKNHFSIVGLFTAFEMFLRRMLLLLHHGDTAMLECIRKMRFDDMKEKFPPAGVDITKPEHDWKSIVGMKKVRNCITHSDSRPDKKRAKDLANYDIPVVQSKMKLPDRYFKKSSDLVERVCKRIAKDCQKALK